MDIENKISTGLQKHGIQLHHDWEQRHDGEFLDNIVFEKGGVIKKIYRPLLLREGGQSHHFVKNGNDFDLVPLTDKEWISNWIYYIKKYFI